MTEAACTLSEQAKNLDHKEVEENQDGRTRSSNQIKREPGHRLVI